MEQPAVYLCFSRGGAEWRWGDAAAATAASGSASAAAPPTDVIAGSVGVLGPGLLGHGYWCTIRFDAMPWHVMPCHAMRYNAT
jgi:hypothetical protein